MPPKSCWMREGHQRGGKLGGTIPLSQADSAPPLSALALAEQAIGLAAAAPLQRTTFAAAGRAAPPFVLFPVRFKSGMGSGGRET